MVHRPWTSIYHGSSGLIQIVSKFRVASVHIIWMWVTTLTLKKLIKNCLSVLRCLQYTLYKRGILYACDSGTWNTALMSSCKENGKCGNLPKWLIHGSNSDQKYSKRIFFSLTFMIYLVHTSHFHEFYLFQTKELLRTMTENIIMWGPVEHQPQKSTTKNFRWWYIRKIFEYFQSHFYHVGDLR